MGLTGAIIEKIKCNGPAGQNNDAFRKRKIRSCLKMLKVWHSLRRNATQFAMVMSSRCAIGCCPDAAV